VLSQGEPSDAAISIRIEFNNMQIDNGTFIYAKHDNLVDADEFGAKARTIAQTP